VLLKKTDIDARVILFMPAEIRWSVKISAAKMNQLNDINGGLKGKCEDDENFCILRYPLRKVMKSHE
jgi:hypothetical protein